MTPTEGLFPPWRWFPCTLCGTCAGVCPANAITFVWQNAHWEACWDEKACTGCGLCTEVCPITSSRRLRDTKDGEKARSLENLIGPALETYTGHAVDDELRYRGASGGVVSALLTYLLEKQKITHALVTVGGGGDVLQGHGVLIDNAAAARQAAGSWYVVTPSNAALRNVPKNARLAVVGLPCQLQGVALAVEAKIMTRPLMLGLFCGGTLAATCAQHEIRSVLGDPGLAKEIKFRGDGWPGTIRIRDHEKSYDISYKRSFMASQRSGMFFFPPGCMLCNDFVGEQADISFGDGWHQGGKGNGLSAVAVHTETGANVAQKAVADGVWHLHPLSRKEMALGQGAQLVSKKQTVKARLFWLKILGKKIPPPLQYHLKHSPGRPGVLNSAGAFLQCLNALYLSGEKPRTYRGIRAKLRSRYAKLTGMLSGFSWERFFNAARQRFFRRRNNA